MEQTRQLFQEGHGLVACSVQMSLCSSDLVPFGKEGEQIGKHKRVGGSLSTFKG